MEHLNIKVDCLIITIRQLEKYETIYIRWWRNIWFRANRCNDDFGLILDLKMFGRKHWYGKDRSIIILQQKLAQFTGGAPAIFEVIELS